VPFENKDNFDKIKYGIALKYLSKWTKIRVGLDTAGNINLYISVMVDTSNAVIKRCICLRDIPICCEV